MLNEIELNTGNLKKVFYIASTGGTNQEMQQCRTLLETWRENKNYLSSLIEILTLQRTIQNQNIRALSAIEIKNLFDKRKSPKISSEEIKLTLKKIMEMIFSENNDFVLRQLYAAVAAVLVVLTRDVSAEVCSFVVTKIKEKKEENDARKAVFLIENILKSNLEHNPNKEKHFLWNYFDIIVSEFKCTAANLLENTANDTVEKHGYFQSLGSILFCLICYGTTKENFGKDKQLEEFFELLIKFLDAAIQHLDVFENSFVTYSKIAFTSQRKYPLHFSKFLRPFLFQAIRIISCHKKIPKNVSFAILTFLNDVFGCTDYKSTTSAALSVLLPNAGKEEIEEVQKMVRDCFKNIEINSFLNNLSTYLGMSDDEEKMWTENGEKFFKHVFCSILENCRTVAFRIFGSISEILPSETTVFLTEKMRECENYNLSSKLDENAICQIFFKKSVCYLAFCSGYSKLQKEFEKSGVFLQNWFLLFTKDIKDAMIFNANSKKHKFLLLSFSISIRALFPGFDRELFSPHRIVVLRTILELFGHNDVVVQLLAEKILRDTLYSNETRVLVEPVLAKIFELYSVLFKKLRNPQLRLEAIRAIFNVLCLFKEKSKQYLDGVFKFLKEVWTELNDSNSAMRMEILEGIISVLNKFPEISKTERNFLLPLIASCLSKERNEIYLNERGFEMLRIYLLNSQTFSKNEDTLFLKFLECIENNIDNTNVSVSFEIIKIFILYKGVNFFEQFTPRWERLVSYSLDSVSWSKRSPIISCMALSVRVLCEHSYKALGTQIVSKVLSSVLSGLDFSKTSEFEVSYRALEFLCLLLFYDYASSLRIIEIDGGNKLFRFLCLVVDSFERIPMLGVRRKLLMGMAACLETKNVRILSLLIENVLQFCYQLDSEERLEEKSNLEELLRKGEITSTQIRSIKFAEREPINKTSLRSYIESKITRCKEINSKETMDFLLSNLNNTVKSNFAKCK